MSSKNLQDVQRALLKSDEEVNTYLENVDVGDLRSAFKELEDKIAQQEEELEWLDCLEAVGVDEWEGCEAAQELMNA